MKEIQPKFAESETQRARFVLEAEITGNLEHPGIVPVYSLGRNAAGRPYYAMRFIEGESLSVAIRRFHQAAATRKDEGKDAQATMRGASSFGCCSGGFSTFATPSISPTAGRCCTAT